jgi:hypothetical protein
VVAPLVKGPERRLLVACASLGPDLLFLPADPPRKSSFAADDPAEPAAPAEAEEVSSVVVPAGGSVRRQTVVIRRLGIAEAVSALLAGEPPGSVGSGSLAAWRAVLLAGLGLIARGRLQPV